MLLYAVLSVFCILDYFQTIALINVGYTELNPIVLRIIGEDNDWNKLLLFKVVMLALLGILLIADFLRSGQNKNLP